jgi:Arf-GAP/Rho-GAP domain/ANK repeat/PH domain-containing protein 3
VHPIMFESYNLCELATSSKLSKFSIQILKGMCMFFELDTSAFKETRKQPFVNLLNVEIIGNCSCMAYNTPTFLSS